MIDYLQVYNMIPETEVLGPFLRFALWLQGCDKRCKGCLSPRSQALDGGEKYEIPDLTSIVLETDNIEGLTISGGEPFLQAAGLNLFIETLKKTKNLGIIVYTGYTLEQIKQKNDANMLKLLDKIDLLIDGEYNEKLNDGKSLRGSLNQEVILLTDRYKKYLGLYGVVGRKVEMCFKDDKICFSGIPGKEFLDNWNNKLK